MSGFARNSFANLLGAAIPAAVSLLTIPYIVSSLGTVSYGVLTLVTAIIGYFAMLDLNLTSGAIKYIAEYKALGNRRALDEVVTFGGLIYLAIGLAGFALLLLFARPIAIGLFKIPASLQDLSVRTLELGAIGFVFGQLQNYLQGIPQALQRYDISSRVESVFGALMPILTVLLLWQGYGLYEIVLLRVSMSVVNVLLLLWVVRLLLPGFRLRRPSREIAVRIAHFSGFAYLSKVAAVTYAQADKLIISSLAGVAALTYYAVPFSLMGRVFSLSFRLGSVLYPLASELGAKNDLAGLQRIYFRAARYLFFLNGCIAITAVLLAREIMGYWMGPTFAVHSSAILALIALASLVDSLTNLPSFVNDGLGFPKVTGLFAVGRTVLGVTVVFLLVTHLGILGAALGQLLASVLGAAPFLIVVHRRYIPFHLTDLLRQAVFPSLPAFLVMTLPAACLRPASGPELGYTLFVLALAALVFLVYGYYIILSQEHRQGCSLWLHRRKSVA